MNHWIWFQRRWENPEGSAFLADPGERPTVKFFITDDRYVWARPEIVPLDDYRTRRLKGVKEKP
jgi:hypothetical protein